MVTRKEFEHYQNMRLNRHELNEAYNEYVIKYKKEQEYEFYREHRSEPWFVERYHPNDIYKRRQAQFKISKFLST